MADGDPDSFRPGFQGWATVNDLYERGFRKIAEARDVRPGEPMLYRTGGAVILLVLTEAGIRAADATACKEVSAASAPAARLQALAECLGNANDLKVDWSQLVEQRSLPAEIREGGVWVCIDLCSSL